MSRVPTFGWDAVRLSGLSLEDLNTLHDRIVNDPQSENRAHTEGRSIFLYTKPAMKKLDALAWAVFYKRQEKQDA